MKRKNLQARILYPAGLSVKCNGEIKSFPEKQKLREFSTTKPALQLNAEETSLGRKHKRKKRPTANKPQTIQQTVIVSCIHACAHLLQLCPTLCNPMDCSLPGSSVHGTSQARILEGVAISSSKGIFPTQGSNPHCLHCRQIL